MPYFLANSSAWPGRGRGDGHHFGLLGHDLKRRRVDVRLELRADDADFHLALVLHVSSKDRYQLPNIFRA